jgi:hypothetical protein
MKMIKVTESGDMGGGDFVMVELANGRVLMIWATSNETGNPIIEIYQDIKTLEDGEGPDKTLQVL